MTSAALTEPNLFILPPAVWADMQKQPAEVLDRLLYRAPGEVFEWPHVGWYYFGITRLKVLVWVSPS